MQHVAEIIDIDLNMKELHQTLKNPDAASFGELLIPSTFKIFTLSNSRFPLE